MCIFVYTGRFIGSRGVHIREREAGKSRYLTTSLFHPVALVYTLNIVPFKQQCISRHIAKKSALSSKKKKKKSTTIIIQSKVK